MICSVSVKLTITKLYDVRRIHSFQGPKKSTILSNIFICYPWILVCNLLPICQELPGLLFRKTSNARNKLKNWKIEKELNCHASTFWMWSMAIPLRTRNSDILMPRTACLVPVFSVSARQSFRFLWRVKNVRKIYQYVHSWYFPM